MKEINHHIAQIINLCRLHKVRKLYVFGSVLRSDFDKESDIDFIVDFSPIDLYQYADNYFAFKSSLESIFHRPVDLLEEKGIRNPVFRKELDSHRQLIYGY